MSKSKDIFLIDTRCRLNEAIEELGRSKGYAVKVRKNLPT